MILWNMRYHNRAGAANAADILCHKICFMTAVEEINSLSAALVKLPQPAAQTKMVSWLLYMDFTPSGINF